MTSYQGGLSFDNTGALRVTNVSGMPGFTGRKRVALFGDSHLAQGYRVTDSTTSTGQFVVSDDVTLGRIATITTGAIQNNFGIGNYVSVMTLGDPNFTLALNGACTPILTKPSATSFTISATYGGQTMAVGDYSNPLTSGKFWSSSSPSWRSDSSLFNWMRMLNNDPFDVTAIYAVTGQLGTALPYLVSRSSYGPAFDIAVISVGSNDMNPSTVLTSAQSMANCYKVFYTLQQSVATLQAAGKQIIVQLPVPASVSSNMLVAAEAEAVFRKLVSNWAGRNNVIVIDAYAQMLDGTLTTGSAYTPWSATNVHINTVGCYNIAKLASISQCITQNPYNIDYQPVGLIEDNSTYAQTATAWVGGTTYAVGDAVRNGQNVYYCTTGGQAAASGGPTGTGSSITDNQAVWAYAGPSSVNIVAHGLMDGTGGGTVAGITGTVPTGWAMLKTGSPIGTTAGNVTRTSITGTNSARWGKEWQISATFSAAGEAVSCYQDLFSRMVSGNWYQFGVTLTAQNSWGSTVKDIWCYLQGGGGSSTAFYPQAIQAGNNVTTYPLVANDVLTLKSEPFYYQQETGQNTFALWVKVESAAAGTANYAVSSAWCRVVQNPTI